ncbi:MAG TPA: ferredoxin-type protein NapG [Aquifex aeolicus]|nr:ferredoxin-type protein NapG [Aquifex aeolicus]
MTDKKPDPRRRKLLLGFLQGIGFSIVGGVVWSAIVSENKKDLLVLRPPGAYPEEEFLKKCIKCGLCVIACANRENIPFDRQGNKMVTLKLAAPGDGKPLGTPYFIPRQVPCYMCVDIPCAFACPTKALDVELLRNEKGEVDINKARMGVAVIDYNSCIAFWGLQCDACVRACPLMHKAIYIDVRRNRRTGKHAMLVPVVDPDYCTGCGLCEFVCPTDKPAIFVLPRDVALGKIGKHYVRGWMETEENVEEKIKEREKELQKWQPKTPEDYLNTGDLLDE